jgi:hypothetical protein
MNVLVDLVHPMVNNGLDLVRECVSFASNGGLLPGAGVGLRLAFALTPMPVPNDDVPEEVLAHIKRWHGSITDRYKNIDNVAILLKANGEKWGADTDMVTGVNNDRNRLLLLIAECDSNDGSATSRTLRNELLRSTVGYCLRDVKLWAYGQYRAGLMTAANVHLLGFLLPGEHGGHHAVAQSTTILPAIKVRAINGEKIRVVIDQSSDENAAQVVHGWPTSVRQALIIVSSAEDKKEVCRKMTTHLHNVIDMPQGSHGKQFMVTASFLRHVSDVPTFGNEVTFSMPLTTSDMVHAADQDHFEEDEDRMRAIEQHRLEIERLEAEMKKK